VGAAKSRDAISRSNQAPALEERSCTACDGRGHCGLGNQSSLNAFIPGIQRESVFTDLSFFSYTFLSPAKNRFSRFFDSFVGPRKKGPSERQFLVSDAPRERNVYRYKFERANLFCPHKI